MDENKQILNNARILAIVPAYNEEATIANVAQTLNALGFCDVLVVNDGSSDKTLEILQGLPVTYLNLPCNLGIGGAVQAGFCYAAENNYDVAFQFDGDGQHDAASIKDIVLPVLTNKADLVVGSRFVGGENTFKSTLARQAGILFLSGILKVATGVRIKDVTSGFRAASKRALKLFASDYPVDYPEPESLAMVLAKGMQVCEVPVIMRERAGGTSSIKGFAPLYYMIKVSIAILISSHGTRAAQRHAAKQKETLQSETNQNVTTQRAGE